MKAEVLDFPWLNEVNTSTKDISLPSVVHVGSGLLKILDVVVPGLLVLPGDGKEKEILLYPRDNEEISSKEELNDLYKSLPYLVVSVYKVGN